MPSRLVFVYKSAHKLRHYLYLAKKDDFQDVPDALLNAFGEPKFLMMFDLSKHESLPKVNPSDLDKALSTKGYFLRIDLEDPEENLLNKERVLKGLKPLTLEELKEV